ncbi:terpene synthase metal-binding domain-containing protein [Calothrix sp. NIES-2100]|uniref:terpene synthase family protein n=1 Tax=Calothrix sp. NIES-2100 TaxID=1954172 RepID=UPI000B5F8A42|nr:terpene synthase metal-binding domain-containing protein [Calothrix sp. NIES-2100]
MEKFIFPDLYCPFPYQINKYADILEGNGIEWLLRFNLLANESSYRRFCKSNFYLLVAGAYPFCELEEINIANDLFSWLFIWDDQCDMSDLGEKPEVLETYHKRFIEILNGAELTSNDISLTYALADLRKRMLKIAKVEWFQHFIQSFQGYFDGCVQEAANREKGITPDIDTYIKIRSLSSAGDITVELIEFCNHLMIPDALRQHDIVKKLKEMTINILAWCNDIFSVPREMASDDVHNLVLVLHYQQQLPLDVAIKRAAEIHDQEIQAMMNLELSLPSFGKELDAEVEQYILGMHSWIRGNLDWYFQSHRYQNNEKLELVKSSVELQISNQDISQEAA